MLLRRLGLAVPLALAALAAPARAQEAADALPAWITASPAEKTVTLELATAVRADGKAAVNGERDGSVQIVVPLGWTVKWRWSHADSAATHSLLVMAEREKLPERAGRPAFTNAMTRAALAGMAVGAQDVTTFTAEEGGWFWLLCGVPGHALGGEWIGLRVDPAASAPALTRTGR